MKAKVRTMHGLKFLTFEADEHVLLARALSIVIAITHLSGLLMF